MSVYTIYICSKHRSIDVNMYIYVYILFLLYLDCKYSQRLYLHTAVYRGRFSQFSGSMYRMNVDTKGGENTIHSSHATFQTQHIQSMAVMDFFGTSNPSEIPEKLSGIWRSDSWALRACWNFRRAMLSSTREPNLGLKLLLSTTYVCRPKYFSWVPRICANGPW